MSNKTSQDYIAKAQELFNLGFTSKAKKKDATDQLNRAYYEARRATDADLRIEHPYFVDGEIIDREIYDAYLAKCDAYPMDLHNVRERHLNEETFGKQTAIVTELFELRAAIKDAEIVPAAVSAEKLMIEEERKAIKKIKDSGFRLDQYITTQWFDCVSHLGNPYVRVNWYQQFKLVSFRQIMKFVASRREFWESNGSPRMSEWSDAEIENFYSKLAA